MTPLIADHIYFIIIAIALPIYSYRSWQSFKRHLANKKPFVLRNGYIETIAIQWSLAIFLIFWWFYASRDFSDLGLVFNLNYRTYISFAIAILGSVFLTAQWIQLTNLKEIPDSLKKQIEPVADLLPASPAERKLFIAVAITAGLVEELIYRGFLIWYLNSYLHWTIAALFSVLIFGYAHAYQGKSGFIKATVVSILMAALLLWSRSLLAPIILHAVLDLTSGFIGSDVKAKRHDINDFSAKIST
jgi:membrane protease YdiL (CAAX protease family)